MTKNQQEAIERACGHENLLGDMVDVLELALMALPPYSQEAKEIREVLSRATSQDVK